MLRALRLEPHYNTTIVNKSQLAAIKTALTEAILAGTIAFPYQYKFSLPSAELFKNLQTETIPVINGTYTLRSYYPPNQLYLPYTYKGSYIHIRSVRGMYYKVDVLSDLFLEPVRLSAKRKDQAMTVLEAWTDRATVTKVVDLLFSEDYSNRYNSVITIAALRDAIYRTVPETRIFNPTWSKALLQYIVGSKLAGLRWLDIAAGWGDRLLTAMALNMTYTGYDPNILLKAGHSQMISLFGDSSKHQIIYEPFELTTIPHNSYDVILSSPPFFDLEDYCKDQVGQSIVSYPTLNDWLVNFLFRSLAIAWFGLKQGGYMILYLVDTKETNLCEVTLLFVAQYLLHAKYLGVIGLGSTYLRPVWVWQKTLDNNTLTTNNLAKLYPTISKMLQY